MRFDLQGRTGDFAIAPLAFGDFLTVDRNVARRFDADANLSSIHRHDGDFNVIAYAKGFTGSSG